VDHLRRINTCDGLRELVSPPAMGGHPGVEHNTAM
jgi:hypothetical protein